MKSELDSIDLRILAELQIDGRQSASALAKKVGVSHSTASTRIRRLLDAKTIRIRANTNSMALGYNTYALMGLEVGHAELEAVADRLCALHDVIAVMVGVGWKEILIWSLFRSHGELSYFNDNELGAIPGIKAVETLTVVEFIVTSPYIHARWERDPGLPSRERDQPPRLTHGRTWVTPVEYPIIDEVDLLILRELEQDGRQPVSQIARKLGVYRGVASSRLKRIVDKGLVRITAIPGPRETDNKLLTLMVLRVSPSEIGGVFDTVKKVPGVVWLAKALGHHNVVIGALLTPDDLRDLLHTQLAGMPGVISVETMIGLKVRKNDWNHLVTLRLERVDNAR